MVEFSHFMSYVDARASVKFNASMDANYLKEDEEEKEIGTQPF